MRRLINISGNNLTVATETTGIGKSIAIQFQPIFSISLEKEIATLNLTPLAQKFYELPQELTTMEQVKFLLDCITRQESNNTDMHDMVTAFCNGKTTDSFAVFSNTGDNLKVSNNSAKKEEEKQSLTMN
jgi:hypothetical protein